MCTTARWAVWMLLVAFVAAGCGGSGDSGGVDDGLPSDVADAGATDIAAADSQDDSATPSDTAGPSDAADTVGNVDAVDDTSGSDVVEGPSVPVFRSLVSTLPTTVLPGEVESCAVYQEERCNGGTVERCVAYDSVAGDWASELDPWFEQILWYDRYYDLYHQMEGQHVTYNFTQRMAPGTPESEWGDPQYFEHYSDFGDGSGWQGTSLQAAAMRYAETGTTADYERMVERFETMMLLYEMNEIPGLLMRSFYAMLEEGAPEPKGHPGKAISTYIQPGDWHFRYPIPEAFLANLPSYFTEGVEIDGTHYGATPVWMGDASRDMYVRGLPGVLLAYDLLGEGERETQLREVVKRELPCTLNRMKKGRILNVQQNPDIVEALQALLASGTLRLEEDDLDLTTLDTITLYVMEQPHPEHMDLFDATCPDGPPMELDEELVIDAGSPTFMVDFIGVFGRVGRTNDRPIAWAMVPSARGSDALFLTQWALVAHYLTGDERYLDYVREVMEESEYWPVIQQMGSFWLPRWCRSHFAPSLLYPTLWNLQMRIDPEAYPEYWSQLATAIKEETRFKELADANDCYFGILYQGMVDAEIDPTASDYLDAMIAMLRETGQRQVEDPFEPRRNYLVDLVSDTPEGIVLEELTEEDRAICEMPVEVFGIEFDSPGVDGDEPRASVGLPIKYRITGDFQWQMDPYKVYRTYGSGEGKEQWPMQGFSAAFWAARFMGLDDTAEGIALGWKPTEASCE